jgi:ketosteroid isomerase-like protein
MSQENIEIARRRACLQRTGYGPLSGPDGPEIEFRSVFERKTYRGLAGMVQWTEDLDATIDELHSEDDRFLEAGEDRIVYLYRIVGTGTGSGVPVSREFAILWRLRDGKLFKGEVYLDQTLALEAAGLSE